MSELIKVESEVTYTFAIQPIVCLSTDNIVGHEILLREYNDKKLTDFNNDPTLFVKHSVALSQCIAELKRKLTVTAKLGTIFVNFNPNQIASDDFLKSLEMFYVNGILPSSIAIEVTEQCYPSKEDLFYKNLDMARRLGHPIIVDDFGSGISNFVHVSRLKPAIVKTDISLIQEAAKDNHSRKFLHALIKFLHDVGSKSIIEGIETEEQRKLAEDLGGDFGQGFYYGLPESHNAQREDREAKPENKGNIILHDILQLVKETPLEAVNN